MAIGVDLGGTKILVARVDGKKVHETQKADTPTTGPADVAATIAELVRSIDKSPKAIGVGTPGQVDEDGVVVGAPNLAGWDEPVPLQRLIADATGCKRVTIDNDVNVATWAEHRHGAAEGHDDVLGVFMGTGVGGGVILHGKVRRGPRGLGGEIGHTMYLPGGRRCGCGIEGHVEAYAGRVGMEREARRRHLAGEQTALVEIAGEQRMKSSVFEKALAQHDTVTEELLEEAVAAAAVAVSNAVMFVDITFVVLGGGMAERLGADFATRIEGAANKLLVTHDAISVVPAALGDNAGVVGAAALVA
jgi:glucokinase